MKSTKVEIRNTILIVDDHRMFADSLELLIETEGIGKIVGKAYNGEQFLHILAENDLPDLVLMDISMPVMDGIKATQEALTLYPHLKILVVSMYGKNEYYQELLMAGVKGFVLKSSGRSVLETAIQVVLEGESYFSNELLRGIIVKMTKEKSRNSTTMSNEFGISQRELQVLEYISKGLTTQEIAEKLCITVKTVNAHRNKLLKKTGCRNQISMILFAIKNKIVSL